MQSNSALRLPARFAAIAAGAVVAAFLTAGCHDDTPPAPVVVTPPASSTTTAASPGSASAPGGVTTAPVPDTKINTNAGPGGSTGTDTALADQINTAIVHNKQMTGSRVEVVATAGVVTLNGTVQNQQQKGLAQTTAQNVPGVGSIKNKLMIVTTGGAKPKPMVVTKTKTVVIHDQAPAPSAGSSGTAPTDSGGTQTPPDTGTTDQTNTPPAPPATGGTTGQ